MSFRRFALWLLLIVFIPSTCFGRSCQPRQSWRLERGRTCPLLTCRSNADCVGGPLHCKCDDFCGKSCVDYTARCPDLTEPANGFIEKVNMVPGHGTTARYYCEEGYRLFGPSERTCRSDQKWSGLDPLCIEIKPPSCPAPPLLDNGYSFPHQGPWKIGSTVSYVCRYGYVFDTFTRAAQATLICTSSRRWSGNLPKCIPQLIMPRRLVSSRCGAPTDLRNGWYELEGSGSVSSTGFQTYYNADDTIIYRCHRGYELLAGDFRRVCTWNGEWTGRKPRCIPNGGQSTERIRCRSPPDVSNGWVEIDRNYGDLGGSRPPITPENDHFTPSLTEIRFKPDDVIIYRCQSAYELAGGSKRRTCKSDGGWTGTQPRCILKERSGCSSPTPPRDGRILSGNKYQWQVGDGYSISCDNGYMEPTPNWATCRSGGIWQPSSLDCETRPTYCPSPPSIQNARYEVGSGGAGSIWPVGSSILYKCFGGYQMLGGNGHSTCSGAGSWTGTSISCREQRIGCGAPVLRNGYLQRSWITSWSIGQSISIVCDPGYQRPSVSRATCVSGGRWSPPALICSRSDVRVYCDAPSKIENGALEIDRNTGSSSMQGSPVPTSLLRVRFNIGDAITYVCNINFQLVGNDRRVCTSSGTWTGLKPFCRGSSSGNGYCQPLPEIDNGAIEIDNNVGSSSSQSSPVLAAFLRVRFTAGDAITYVCNRGYQLIGNDRRVCTSSGTWTGAQPFCRGRSNGYCSQPRLLNGYIETDRNVGQSSPGQEFEGMPLLSPIRVRYTTGIAIEYICNDGFVLVGGDRRRVCTSSGSWTGIEPRCSRGFRFGSDSDSVYCDRPVVENGYIEIDTDTEEYQTMSPLPVSKFAPGDTIMYLCNTGFVLMGSDTTRICTPSGMWSGTEPACSWGFRSESDGHEEFYYSYTVTTERLSYQDAIHACKEMDSVLVLNSIMNTEIRRKIFGSDGEAEEGVTYWIGLSKSGTSSRWMWENDEPLLQKELEDLFSENGHDSHSYGYSSCALITGPDDEWMMKDCSEKHRAICQKEQATGRSVLPSESDSASGDAILVVPIRIELNETGNLEGGQSSCLSEPCLNGCACEDYSLGGYFCRPTSAIQYLGSNCEYDPPQVYCLPDEMEISITADLLTEMMGDAIAYLAPEKELAQDLYNIGERCLFSPSLSDHTMASIIVPFPFEECDTLPGRDTEGRMTFTNQIWLVNADGSTAPSSIAEITCSYQDIYKVSSTLDTICCPTPPLITSHGVFKFEATMWNDPPGTNRSAVHRNEEGLVPYVVGEMLYLTVELNAGNGMASSLLPMIRTCWLSPNRSSNGVNPTMDLLLHPASNSHIVKTVGPTNTPMAVHFGFQLVRAKRSSIVYLHCHVQVVSGRGKRSLSETYEDEVPVTKGPIVFITPIPRETSNNGMGDNVFNSKFILGVSFFGCIVLLLILACCAVHLRSISARERQNGPDGLLSSPLNNYRSRSNLVHPVVR